MAMLVITKGYFELLPPLNEVPLIGVAICRHNRTDEARLRDGAAELIWICCQTFDLGLTYNGGYVVKQMAIELTPKTRGFVAVSNNYSSWGL